MTQPTHGGPRPGAGRKPRRDGRKPRILRIWLSDEEYQYLLARTDPDLRREILLSGSKTDSIIKEL